MERVFDTIKSKKGDEIGVMLEFDEDGVLSPKSNCTCKWGSFHRWSKRNQKKRWICRHVLKTYKKIKNISYSEAREELIKQGILHPEHLVKE